MTITEAITPQVPHALDERTFSIELQTALNAVISHGEVGMVPEVVLQNYLDAFHRDLTKDYDHQDETTTYYGCLSKKLQANVNVFLLEEGRSSQITHAATCAKAIDFQIAEDERMDAPTAATKLMHGFLGQLYPLELYWIDVHAPDKTVPLTKQALPLVELV